MRDPTLKAYLASVAAAATTTFLVFMWRSGLYGIISNLGDLAWTLSFWLIAFMLTLVGTFVPAAAMVGIAQRLKIRSALYYIAWSLAASLGPACLASWLLGPPDLRPMTRII